MHGIVGVADDEPYILLTAFGRDSIAAGTATILYNRRLGNTAIVWHPHDK